MWGPPLEGIFTRSGIKININEDYIGRIRGNLPLGRS